MHNTSFVNKSVRLAGRSGAVARATLALPPSRQSGQDVSSRAGGGQVVAVKRCSTRINGLMQAHTPHQSWRWRPRFSALGWAWLQYRQR